METPILFLFIIFISSVLQGISGFGFALIAAPLTLLFFDQQTTVVILTMVSLILNLFLIKKIKSDINKQMTLKLILAGFAGVILGVIAISQIDPKILKLVAVFFATTFTFALLLPNLKFNERKTITIIMGAITGFLQASISLSGPPLVLILSGYGLEAAKIRKTLAVVFFSLSMFTLPLFLMKNILTWDRAVLGLWALPLVVIGGQIGNFLSERVPKKLFKILAQAISVGASLQVAYKVLMEFHFI